MPSATSSATTRVLARADSAPASIDATDQREDNATRARPPRPPRPHDVGPPPKPLYFSERKQYVAIDPSTLAIVDSKNPDEERFRHLPAGWPSSDPAVRAVMGRRGAYVDPKGKVVCERGSDAHRAGLAALRDQADASGKTINEKRHGAAVLTAALATAGLVTALSGGNIVLGILAGIGAALATTIYLNGRDHFSTQYAIETRLRRFEETGKLDAATSLSERLAHRAKGPLGRTAARFLAGALGDAREAAETHIGNLAQGVINAPPASNAKSGERGGG